MGLLLLIDGHAYAYRAFHAIRDLKSPAGRPTNAIFGFIKALEKLCGRLKPTHLAVVWDGGLADERTRLLPEYKAQRPPMPDAMEEQLDEIVAYLDAAGYVSLCEEGVEADDWIARLAVDTAAEADVVIASADKDFMQLVGPRIRLLNPNDRQERLWGREEVLAKCGVEPGQVVDWLSLMGDSVDNIPGVTGVGPKTASALIQEFGSIEGIYRRLEQVGSERLRRGLLEAEENVRRNQSLIKLGAKGLRGLSLDELERGRADAGRLKALYERWGFRSLAAAVAEPAQPQLL